MPRKKQEQPVEAPETAEVAVDSPQKQAYREFLKKYREQSPHKYALKERELLVKLNKL